jgi:GrpB-like predicted nucleotidyltransferase (UPF0157 family)
VRWDNWPVESITMVRRPFLVWKRSQSLTFRFRLNSLTRSALMQSHSLGYQHVPHSDDAVCPFFHRPSEWPHSHHVHVVESGGLEERRTLAFRDYLRDHSDVAHEYGLLKEQLFTRYDAAKPADREMYASAKTEFINRVVQIALAQGYPRELRNAV